MTKTDVTPAANRRTVEIEYAFGETKVIADEVTTERMKRGFGVFLAREVLPGEITITRDDLERVSAVLCDEIAKSINGQKDTIDVFEILESQFWPEGQHERTETEER